jgi:hypothetical protein
MSYLAKKSAATARNANRRGESETICELSSFLPDFCEIAWHLAAADRKKKCF